MAESLWSSHPGSGSVEGASASGQGEALDRPSVWPGGMVSPALPVLSHTLLVEAAAWTSALYSSCLPPLC